MLPEVLSNGACSLQEGQKRFCKSAFIRYDASGRVVSARLAETVIRSAKRLHYAEAQQIIDGRSGGYDRTVVGLLRRMNDLARRIQRRRREQGMVSLDLPAVEIVPTAVQRGHHVQRVAEQVLATAGWCGRAGQGHDRADDHQCAEQAFGRLGPSRGQVSRAGGVQWLDLADQVHARLAVVVAEQDVIDVPVGRADGLGQRVAQPGGGHLRRRGAEHR